MAVVGRGRGRGRGRRSYEPLPDSRTGGCWGRGGTLDAIRVIAKLEPRNGVQPSSPEQHDTRSRTHRTVKATCSETPTSRPEKSLNPLENPPSLQPHLTHLPTPILQQLTSQSFDTNKERRVTVLENVAASILLGRVGGLMVMLGLVTYEEYVALYSSYSILYLILKKEI